MLTLVLAAALAFPVPASPPIPVTTPVLARPPLRQLGLQVASNGSIALAVWSDERNGRPDVTACRIAADGTPLDPIGIVIRSASSLDDVFWNGTSFAVVTHPVIITAPGEDAFVLMYVSADGVVTRGSTLAPDLMIYGARASAGADTRFLFLPGDGFSPLARVVDQQGAVIRQGSSDRGGATFVNAASNGSGFLALRGFAVPGGNGTLSTFVAEALDRDGNVLSSKDPQLPATFVPAALTGDGEGGYALFGYIRPQQDFVVVRLDATGVAKASPQFLQANDPVGPLPASVTARTVGNNFVASWMADLPDHHTRTYVSRDGGLPVMTFEWIGHGSDAAYDPVNDLVLTSYDDAFTSMSDDVFVQKGSGPPAPLTYSAHQQTNAAIASGANGFLAAWNENSGTDAVLYVRRFSPEGTPLDEAQAADSVPIKFDLYVPFQKPLLTSSGDSYLVVASDRALARRLDARSGRWLDATPFELRDMAAASNGSDVLALTLEDCGHNCTKARRISMSGDLVISDGAKLSDYGLASQPAIASDGRNYLAVWNDGAPNCSPDCVLPGSTRLVAMRLRPDGTQIDASPIVLDSAATYQASPSVAWNGQTYLVIWATGSVDEVSGAYVSADGAVQPLGTIAKFHELITSLKAVAHAGSFVILTEHPVGVAGYPPPDGVSLTLLDGSTIEIETRPSDHFGPIDGASDGVHLMLAYDRADPLTGRAGRVVLDPRVFPSRKRAVH